MENPENTIFQKDLDEAIKSHFMAHILPIIQIHSNLNYVLRQEIGILKETLELLLPQTFALVSRNVRYTYEIRNLLDIKNHTEDTKIKKQVDDLLFNKMQDDPLRADKNFPLFDMTIMIYYKEQRDLVKDNKEEINAGQISPDGL